MEIKGTAIIAIRDFVKNNYPDKFNPWLASLNPEAQTIFSSVIDSSKWYPLKDGGIEPTRKIADMFYGRDYKKGAWESGIYSANKALTGIYKIFVRASSPGYIIQRASRVFSTYYQPCQMKVIERTEKSVVVQITNMTESDVVIEHRIGGWMEKALTISGAANVKINFERSITKGDPDTTFNINWN